MFLLLFSLFLAFLSLLLIQFSAGAQIVSAIAGWSYLYSLFATGIIIATYLIFGGFQSVLVTDVVQGIVMLILLPLILWAVGTNEVVETTKTSFEQLDLLTISSFVFTGLFVVAASADIWQRIYAARDNKSAKAGLVLAAILFIVFGFGIAGLGVFAKVGLPNIDPNNAFVESVVSLMPKWAFVTVILLVFSSIMSTADTEIFLLSSILSREITRWKNGYKSNRETSENTKITIARVCVVVITLLGLILSAFFVELVDIYVFLLSIILIISPPLLLGLRLKLNDKSVSISIILSLITFISLIITGNLNANNIVLIVIPGFLFTLISKFTIKIG